MALRKLEDKPPLYPIVNDSLPEVNESAPIPGGYYIMARKIDESEIAHAAPCIRELWHWILRQVNYKANHTLGISKGQTVRTIADMQEGLHWFVGYRKMTYSKTQCEGALEFLRKRHMITTTKTTRGLIITVCKYEFYSNPDNYENNTEGNKKTTRRQQPPSTINKKDKESKEGEESGATVTGDFYQDQINANASDPLIGKYKNFIAYLKGNNDEKIVFKSVLKMENQITFSEYLKLRDKVMETGVNVYEVLKAMENKSTLVKDNKSLYLTANNWINVRLRDKK